MKKTFALVLLSVLMLSACSSPLQDEILAYANEELPKLGKLEEEAMEKYEEAVSSNSEVLIAKSINNEVIPAYTKIAEGAGKLTIEDEELEKLHNRYLAAVNQQIEGFEMFAQSIEQKDDESYNTANEMIEKTYSEMESFRSDLEAYAVENDLEVEESKE